MNLKNFYRELVRRNVFRAVLAYLPVAWVLIEFSSVILPTFDAPSYLLQGIIYLLAIGLIFWTGFAWVYDLTPEGWQKTPEHADTKETRQIKHHFLNMIFSLLWTGRLKAIYNSNFSMASAGILTSTPPNLSNM